MFNFIKLTEMRHIPDEPNFTNDNHDILYNNRNFNRIGGYIIYIIKILPWTQLLIMGPLKLLDF